MSTAERHSTSRLKPLAVRLLVLLLTGGCSDNKDECEITCADGFKTTQEGACSRDDVTTYNHVHGNCRLTTIHKFDW